MASPSFTSGLLELLEGEESANVENLNCFVAAHLKESAIPSAFWQLLQDYGLSAEGENSTMMWRNAMSALTQKALANKLRTYQAKVEGEEEEEEEEIEEDPDLFTSLINIRYTAAHGSEFAAKTKIHGHLSWTQFLDRIYTGFRDNGLENFTYPIKQVTCQGRKFADSEPPTRKTGDIWPWLNKRVMKDQTFVVWGFSEQGSPQLPSNK
eukprot:TRINITY_DN7252_c0_g1_i2.p1 TRINITY_DN7252_c0_g1~~TRINITY_DN7252_c0_g1_i2.p1  ORF type:complete len:209 (-),score=37.66 TRINITY_DN7252_c0_g1_i2:23-649(-)